MTSNKHSAAVRASQSRTPFEPFFIFSYFFFGFDVLFCFVCESSCRFIAVKRNKA
jgi:hypothetical protein